MKLSHRVRRLEGPVGAGRCRACAGRVMALRYDPPLPPGVPATFAGMPVPPVECPVCGRPPGLVLTVALPPGLTGGNDPGPLDPMRARV